MRTQSGRPQSLQTYLACFLAVGYLAEFATLYRHRKKLLHLMNAGVTVRRLANHSSGLPLHFNMFYDAELASG